MSFSKRVEAYPAALLELLETIVEKGESRELKCASDKEALQTRMKIYGLRAALTRNNHPMKDKFYSFTINIDGPKLIFRFADDTPVADAARSLLAQVNGHDRG